MQVIMTEKIQQLGSRRYTAMDKCLLGYRAIYWLHNSITDDKWCVSQVNIWYCKIP